MSSLIASSIGAFIATYFLSRGLLVAFSGLLGWPRIAAAHLVSLSLLVLFTGFLKNYFVAFPVTETLIYIVPQICWLAFDNMRDAGRRNLV